METIINTFHFDVLTLLTLFTRLNRNKSSIISNWSKCFSQCINWIKPKSAHLLNVLPIHWKCYISGSAWKEETQKRLKSGREITISLKKIHEKIIWKGKNKVFVAHCLRPCTSNYLFVAQKNMRRSLRSFCCELIIFVSLSAWGHRSVVI